MVETSERSGFVSDDQIAATAGTSGVRIQRELAGSEFSRRKRRSKSAGICGDRSQREIVASEDDRH